MIDFLSTRFSHAVEVPQASASAACLLVRIYPVDGIEQPLELATEPQLVGRDANCAIPLCDDSVSRRHALLEYNGTAHVVSDLGSLNGTYVNEQRLTGAQTLAAGDRLRFGNQIFKYLTSDGIESQYHEVVFKMMTTDGLTSVHNKRYFLETLDRELLQSCRAKTPLCVMMLDLDNFKSINDTYGHLAGDAVLVEFVKRAKSVLRGGELLARYGGEEFTMLMTRASLLEAVPVAERLRHIVAASAVVFEGTPIPITVSIGICGFDGHRVCEASDLLATADEYLYVAKRSGRNQVQFQRESESHENIAS